MDLRRMRIFQEVAHLGSFTKAAQRLYMSQPAVSKAIRELEEEIQTPLFERFPKKVILTPEGERFLKSVKSLFLQYDSLQEEISQLSAHAHLRIGSSITIANSSLCELLAQLQAEFNAMDVSIEVASSAAILTKLKENQLDIAYVEGMIPEEDFTHIPVAAYAIYAVTAPSFLAQHPLTCMQDFAALPLLLREEGSAIREVVDSLFVLEDVSITPAWTSTNSTVLLKAAVQGFGIAFLPEAMIQKKVAQNQLCIIELPQLPLHNHNHIVYRKHKHLNAAMQRLIALAKDHPQ